MKKRHLLALLILISFPCTVFGTSQIPDEMYLNGKMHYVYGLKLTDSMNEKLSFNSEKFGRCSANWDGFKAKLIIKDNKLFIDKLDVGCAFLNDQNYKTPNPETIFGVRIPDSGLFAHWFSGTLSEYFGEAFVNHTKSNIRQFEFDKGILLNITEKENELYKEYKAYIESKKPRK
jgi:hypothetical protein